MKMAAAEALYDTEEPRLVLASSPSARLDGSEEMFAIKIPDLLSFLATGSTDGEVEGINELRAQYRRSTAGPGAAYYPRRLHARSSRSPTGRSG